MNGLRSWQKNMQNDLLPSRLPGESDASLAARARLIARPDWFALREALALALGQGSGSQWVSVKGKAEAMGVWTLAREDLSWVAEAFLDSGPLAGGASCVNGFGRIARFKDRGFDWSKLAKAVLATAVARIEELVEIEHPQWLHDLDHDLEKAQVGGAWALFCARNVGANAAIWPSEAQRLGEEGLPLCEEERLRFLAALGKWREKADAVGGRSAHFALGILAQEAVSRREDAAASDPAGWLDEQIALAEGTLLARQERGSIEAFIQGAAPSPEAAPRAAASPRL
jgi:hypothetical protein